MEIATSSQQFMTLGRNARQNGNRAQALQYFQEALALNEKDEATNLAVADELLALSRVDEAEVAFRAVLDSAPENYEALMGLGYLARQRGDYAAALIHFEVARAVHPKRIQPSLEMSTELCRLGRLDEAEGVYHKIRTENPEEVMALIGLGQIARQRGEPAVALQQFQAALAIHAGHIGAQLEAAAELGHLDRLDEAEAMYREVLDVEPKNCWALVGLANLARKRGDRKAALSWFQAAANENPRHVGATLEFASEALEAGRLGDAESGYRRVLELSPRNFRALLGLGYVARRRGDHSAALEQFTVASEVEPETAGAWLEAATELIDLGRVGEAETVYKALLAQTPNHVGALVGLGKLARQRGDHAEALTWFEQGAAAKPDETSVQIEISIELGHRGQYEKAEAILLGVLERSSKNVWAMMGLGNLARKRGDRISALAHFQAAAAADSRQLDAMVEVSEILRELGRLYEARQTISLLIKNAPDNVRVWMQRGYFERHCGHQQNALAAFATAYELNPRNLNPLIEIAAVYRSLGNSETSERILHRVLEIDPQHREALIQLTDHAMASEEFERAIILCERTIACHPRSLSPYLTQALALANVGNPNGALKVLERAECLLGHDSNIDSMKLQTLLGAGMLDAACALRAKVDLDRAQPFWLWYQCVQLDLELGNLASVAEALNTAPTHSAHEAARIAHLRGQLAEAQWQPDQAVVNFADAIRLDPQNGWLHEEMSRASLLALDVEAAWQHLRQSLEFDKSASKRPRNQPLNVSQSHMGQLIDEFRLDSAALWELQKIQKLPLATRLTLLRDAVGRDPDHTPSAIQFMIALRQADCFRGPPKGELREREGWLIPRRIIQYWDSAEPPAELYSLMRSWRDFNPDFEYKLFDDRAALGFLQERYTADVANAYGLARYPAAKADIFRLAFLCAEGGFYSDADNCCCAALANIVPPDADLVLHQDWYGTLGNNFIGAVSNQPVLKRALDLAVISLNRGDRDVPWLATGPGLLTRSLAQLLSETESEPAAWLKRCVVLQRWDLKRAVASHIQITHKKQKMNWLRDRLGGR